MNILQSEQKLKVKNYWCTWRTQETVRKNKKLNRIHNASTPDVIDEDFLFGNIGVLNTFDNEIRKDIMIVLDDGWDVEYDLKPDWRNGGNDDFNSYGSFVLNENRFPSFIGEPKERLKKLNDKVKSMGYAGIGLWIAIQMPGCNANNNPSAEEAREYWEERMEWFKFADIKYLKIDWGHLSHDMEYRKMINETAKKIYPEIIVEQAFNQDMRDVRFKEHETQEYIDRVNEIAFYLKHGDTFRVYDAIPEFRHTTIISRTIEAFKSVQGNSQECNSIPNVEDAVYVGAALGCTIGAMRKYCFEKLSEYNYHAAIQTPDSALKRALIWQRTAPPFEINKSDFKIYNEYVTDSYLFPYIEGNPWPFMSEKLMVQDCCLGMSRNMELPLIELPDDTSHGEKPYVVSSINPITHALSIYSAPRTIGGSCFYSILADVTVIAENSEYPIGIFGKYHQLKFVFKNDINIENKRVYAQDMATTEAEDITNEVEICDNVLIIKGDTINRVGLTTKECDSELPGMAVILK